MKESLTPSATSPQSQAGSTTVGALFSQRVRIQPHDIALVQNQLSLTYTQLNERVNRLANGLLSRGLQRGDRLALLTRNCMAYAEIELAAAKIGVIVAALNWRLADGELVHCIQLVGPTLVITSSDYQETLARLNIPLPSRLSLGDDYEQLIADSPSTEPDEVVDAEDGLVIVYTSGTTGLPKAAVISHRAMIARALLFATDFSLPPDSAFVAWAPFFHMASTDFSLITLMRGGPVVVVDGYNADALIEAIENYRIGWLVLIPGMLDEFLSVLRTRQPRPKGIQVIGAMADLVSPNVIAEITQILQAPYGNTFGATETGMAPASAGFIGIGQVPTDLAKQQSSFCEIRLVDEQNNEVAVGEAGECAIRGPTLFSGYWQASETNAKDFRGGWFHMGDVFKRRGDGRLMFMDRRKYMIKSGGENIYPAEIERVLLADDRVADAVVVRRPDRRWGEVVVAAVARNEDTLSVDQLTQRCRENLAGYKIPHEIRFVDLDELPRSTTGKIMRHEVEAWFVPADS